MRRLIPAANGRAGRIVIQPFVGEEGKEAVPQDGASSRAAPVVEAVGITHVAVVVAIVLCASIQAWAVRLEKKAAMILVRPVLRDDLDLCAAVASVFGVVVVRKDFDFLDGVFVRCDDGRPAPSDTGSSDAIDLVVVFAGASTVGGDLATVFNFEDTVRAARATNRGPRQVLRASAGAVRAITEGTRSQLQKLEGIAAEGRQLLDVLVIHGPRKVGSFCIDERRGVAADFDGFRNLPDVELDVQGVGLFGDDPHVGENFFLETGLLHGQRILAWGKSVEVVNSIVVGRGS